MRSPTTCLLVVATSLLVAACGGGGGGGGAPLDAATGWITQLGGSADPVSLPPSMARMPDGGLVVVGTHDDTAIFGAGEATELMHTPPVGASGEAGHIARYDKDGALLWAKILDGFLDDEIQDVAAFADGSFVIVGQFRGSLGFAVGEPEETFLATDDSALFLAWFEADGRLNWVEQIDGDTDGTPALVAANDRDESVYLALGFTGEITIKEGSVFETVLDAGPTEQWAVVALTRIGKLDWVRNGQSAGTALLYSIDAAPNGDLVGVGAFRLNVSLDNRGEVEPNLQSGNALSHGFGVRLFALSGNTNWLKRLGAAPLVYPRAVDAGPSGQIAVGGVFGGDVTFGIAEPGEVTLPAATGLDGFVLRLDAGGHVEWARRFDAAIGEARMGLDVDLVGDVRLMTTVGNDAVFGPGEAGETEIGNESVDIVLAHYGAFGALQDVVVHGGPGQQIGMDMVVLGDGSIVLLGQFDPNAAIGGGGPSDLLVSGPAQTFLARLGPDGRF